MEKSDREWAEDQCRERGVRYLSHETYITGSSHQVWIAVEDWSGRYELKLNRS